LGYNTFSQALSIPFTDRLYSFQRDTDGLREIVSTGPDSVLSWNEDGSLYNSGIFTPKLPPRMVNSRSYGYFFSGDSDDLKKWDGGNTPGEVTKWGIDFPSTISTLAAGPNTPSAAAGWTNSNNALVLDNINATTTTNVNITDSAALTVSGFGFSIPSNATILGVNVAIRGNVQTTDATTSRVFVAVLKRTTSK